MIVRCAACQHWFRVRGLPEGVQPPAGALCEFCSSARSAEPVAPAAHPPGFLPPPDNRDPGATIDAVERPPAPPDAARPRPASGSVPRVSRRVGPRRAHPGPPPDISVALSGVDQLIADGQFDDARLLLGDLLQEFPEHPTLDRFRRPGSDARRLDPTDDLREVDFLHEVGLVSDATALFREIQGRYPEHPSLAGRTPTGARAAHAAATPDAVIARNVTPPSGSRSVDTAATVRPKLPRGPFPPLPRRPRPAGRSTPTAAFRLDDLSDVLKND